MLHRGKQLYVFLFANKNFAVLMRIHHTEEGEMHASVISNKWHKELILILSIPYTVISFQSCAQFKKNFKIRFISCDYRMNILDFDLNMNWYIQHFRCIDVIRIFCILHFRYAGFYLHA